MKTRLKLILPFIVILLPAICFAAPGVNGRHSGPKDYVRPMIKPEIDGRMLALSPSTGTQKVAVILVQFSGAGLNTAGTDTSSHLLTSADIIGFQDTMNYMKAYYSEASYGKLNLDFTYHYQLNSINKSTKTLTGSETPITLNFQMSYYGEDTEYYLEKLIKDSLIEAPLVTASSYSAVIVAHAGYGNESTQQHGYDGDIWSSVIGPFSIPKSGFYDGVIIPAREFGNDEPVGVTCHEFGHILGLPDLYSTNVLVSQVGKWCLMDYGPWVNDGKTPPHPCAWCKKYLGWIEPITLNKTQQSCELWPVETSSATVYRISVSSGNTTEYFLISYSTKTAYNPRPPGGGILIWHIDEGNIDGVSFSARIDDNTINNYSHNTIDIVPADYSHPQNDPYGDSTDPWPGIKNEFANPDSDTYSGEPTGINIADISFSAGKAVFMVKNLILSDLINISKVINYPNPAGSGYYHPDDTQGVITTFVANLTKTPQDINLTIFTIAGEKVLHVPKNLITLQLDSSIDYKLIYEYDWDGKNSFNEDVAPGLYLYRFRVDNEVKTGKMAVIR